MRKGVNYCTVYPLNIKYYRYGNTQSIYLSFMDIRLYHLQRLMCVAVYFLPFRKIACLHVFNIRITIHGRLYLNLGRQVCREKNLFIERITFRISVQIFNQCCQIFRIQNPEKRFRMTHHFSEFIQQDVILLDQL